MGTFAVTGDTGEIYVKQVASWAFIGIREYATAALLLADTVQVGAIATALDESSVWQYSSTGWRCLTIRSFPDIAGMQAWVGTPAQGVNLGDTAITLDKELTYVRTPSGWHPQSLWEDTEANIRAATWPLNGQEAIATDSGRTFARIGNAWIEEPIQHYATEALLLAATTPNGTLAWADDTNVVFTRAAGTWHRLQGPQISYGTTGPTTPATGDMWFNSNANRNTLYVWSGTAWVGTTGLSIGTTGSKILIPGYFNEAPSSTANSDDVGGLAFWYYGGQTQLYMNRNNAWNAATPIVGNPANAGKIAIADTNGNMTWGNLPHDERISADNWTSADHVLDLAHECEEWFEMWGFVESNVNFTAIPRVKYGGNFWNFGSASSNAAPHSMCSYENGGRRDCTSAYFTTHIAGFTYRNVATYDVKAGHPLHLKLRATRLGSGAYWMYELESTFLSANDTPMQMVAGWQLNNNANITGLGVQMRNYQGSADANGPYSLQFRYK